MMDVISGQVPDDWRRQHPDFDSETLFKQWNDMLASGRPQLRLDGTRISGEHCTSDSCGAARVVGRPRPCCAVCADLAFPCVRRERMCLFWGMLSLLLIPVCFGSVLRPLVSSVMRNVAPATCDVDGFFG